MSNWLRFNVRAILARDSQPIRDREGHFLISLPNRRAFDLSILVPDEVADGADPNPRDFRVALDDQHRFRVASEIH
jgi:hypothetical protein